MEDEKETVHDITPEQFDLELTSNEIRALKDYEEKVQELDDFKCDGFIHRNM